MALAVCSALVVSSEQAEPAEPVELVVLVTSRLAVDREPRVVAAELLR